MKEVVIVDYGAGNIRSVEYALNRLGIEPVLSNDPEVIRKAGKVIFPGQGEAGNAMKDLTRTGLDKVIPDLNQPFLGICLGIQLMCNFTEENNTRCLNIFPHQVKKFNGALKVPHMGWNTVKSIKSPLFQNLAEGDYFYFVHSYYVPMMDHTIATTEYGLEFSAAIQKDNFYACQFHPEKSGKAGEKLLKNFIDL